MLSGCTEDKLAGKSSPPIVIDQAVDFLQALLDLVSKIQIHLEVSCWNLYTHQLITKQGGNLFTLTIICFENFLNAQLCSMIINSSAIIIV